MREDRREEKRKVRRSKREKRREKRRKKRRERRKRQEQFQLNDVWVLDLSGSVAQNMLSICHKFVEHMVSLI